MNTMKTKTLLAALTASAMLAGSATAEVIYSDSFGRSGTLNGSAPDTAPGSETWTATNWTTDGSQAKHQVTNALANHAMLPFTPEAGKIYTLKADLDANAANSGWFVGIGFAPSLNPATVVNGYPSLANPFIYESYNTWRAWMPLGGATSPVAGGTATAGAQMYAIELDTTDPLWTVSFFVHGNATPVATQAYTTNPTITHVGIMTWAPSYDGNAAFVDNFELSVVPEPGSLALLGLGGLLIGTRRRRD